ncbi:MAG: peptidoglycan bridge formation glycyltransferase FemA/FemB family protein [Patescibacteria group bacterium]
MKTTEFLQSEHWLRFQEAAGRDIIRFSDGGFSANGIIHTLPIVGKYLYVPRGPVGEISNFQFPISKLIEEAKKQKMKWIRIEPETEEALREFKRIFGKDMVKAPHDTQPREILVADISRSEEELLAAMKSKTRYNIRLAEKHGVKVFETREKKYQQAFLDLMQATADRKEITPHPRAYYEKFLTAFSEDMCRLFVAEYDGPASTREDSASTRGGQVLAANLLMIFGTTATYLHGGSGDRHREMMAPYLLQWEQMRYAKAKGCTRYDFGGVKTGNSRQTTDNGEAAEPQADEAKSSWQGITRFKTGFSPETAPVVFPGGYDIILNPPAYALYGYLRRLQESFGYIRKFISR